MFVVARRLNDDLFCLSPNTGRSAPHNIADITIVSKRRLRTASRCLKRSRDSAVFSPVASRQQANQAQPGFLRCVACRGAYRSKCRAWVLPPPHPAIVIRALGQQDSAAGTRALRQQGMPVVDLRGCSLRVLGVRPQTCLRTTGLRACRSACFAK